MASLAFFKDPETTDHGFYLKMKSGLLQVAGQMDAALRKYHGTFEFTVDMYNPGVQYCRQPGEDIDETLLQSHILMLRSKQYEIAVNHFH
jgi:hypothetical protein